MRLSSKLHEVENKLIEQSQVSALQIEKMFDLLKPFNEHVFDDSKTLKTEASK